MSRSLDIKNLSAALEMLSHMQGCENICMTIRRTIDNDIEMYGEDQSEEMKRRYEKPQTQVNIPDDDIPF